ncbi:transposase [Chryseobacterium carnipullorum]|uniref:transposase n=1 Tax=Chryseobacterium carnipullorum TaxID=1124835 RepID=UPI000E919F23|nr:transposase [Chryseobacterium carnipullorum]HBV14928.1 transposase [Chryseobacterium carnipullorum]
MNFKDIHIGSLIRTRVLECDIEIPRITKFLNVKEESIEQMYESKSLESEVLLRWSKLLEYDFFRIYSQHLILYSPPSNSTLKKFQHKNKLPHFRKNIYSKEIIFFILEMIKKGEKTKTRVIQEYNIPKTTLYKWLDKYSTDHSK